MSWRAGSRGDRGKAPVYATSHGDDSSDDETTSAGERVARVLHSRFDRGEEDTGPADDISIETRSRRWRSVEMASVSSKSHTVSSGAFLLHRLARGRGASGGEMRAKDLVIDIDVDFSRDEVLPKLGPQRCSLRPRFPPYQAGADAHTGAVDRGIRDTRLQWVLKDHPSAQARRGEGGDKLPGQGAWSTFLRLVFALGTHQRYAEFLREQVFGDFLRIPPFTMRHDEAPFT